MTGLHRCVTCHRLIWWWSHFGFLYFGQRVEYWHAGRCAP